RARHVVSYPTSTSRNVNDLWNWHTAEMLAECAQISVDRRGMAHDESRNEPKERIVDGSAFRDRHTAVRGAVGFDNAFPGAAERHVVVGDSRDHAARRVGDLHDHFDGAVTGPFTPHRA